MKNLFSPWRNSYSQDVSDGKTESTQECDCIFCWQLAQNNDPEYFILRRFAYHAVMLNKYPYNAGHILIIPLSHIPKLENLSIEGRTELMELTHQTVIILEKNLKQHGTNIGINLGKASGAGIPSHLHMHILPRWEGDTNFMPTLSQTKVISFDLSTIYDQIKPDFDAL